MGFFGSGDKSQATTVQNLGASDEGVVLGGQKNTNLLNSGVAVTGSKGVNIGTTIEATDSNVTLGYDANAFNAALGNVGNTLTAALDKQSTAGKSILDSTLNKISELAESKLTEGDSDRNKIILYVVAGVLLLVGVIFWRK
jgi:hypothetical protein